MRKISWDKQAAKDLEKAIRYIRKDSPSNADKVKRELLEKISELPHAPEKHTPDKYKLNNTAGHYRAFELHRFRISYLVKEQDIIIARIRQTQMEPLNY